MPTSPHHFHLLIIGDEILSGKHQDKHFVAVQARLAARGLGLQQVTYLGDDRARLTDFLRASRTSAEILFSCGGIGATPDDHTRQAAAAALGLPLRLHPDAEALIAKRCRESGLPLTPNRLEMGTFPQGASIIPNPVNQIPGFSLEYQHFVPGFPEMAWPMLEWVLDRHYPHLHGSQRSAERGMLVRGLAEATLTPLMANLEADFPGIKVFSLPILNRAAPDDYCIELGVKGPAAGSADLERLEAAFSRLRDGSVALGGEVSACPIEGNTGRT